MIKKENTCVPSTHTNILTPEQCAGINHVAISADGCRRWAKKNSVPKKEGHRKGALEVIPNIVKTLWANGVHTVTIWCFATNNWERSKYEVAYLMSILNQIIDAILPLAQTFNGKIMHLGHKSRFPKFLQEKIDFAQSSTQKNTTHTCNLAMDYSSHDEIACAIKKIVKQDIDLKTLDYQTISNMMFTGNQKHPNPDIIIRTGSTHLSRFMLWQSIFSEFYFSGKLFPDINEEDLANAVTFFRNQKRNFGK